MHKNLPGMYFTIFTNNIWSFILWSPVIYTLVYCSDGPSLIPTINSLPPNRGVQL